MKVIATSFCALVLLTSSALADPPPSLGMPPDQFKAALEASIQETAPPPEMSDLVAEWRDCVMSNISARPYSQSNAIAYACNQQTHGVLVSACADRDTQKFAEDHHLARGLVPKATYNSYVNICAQQILGITECLKMTRLNGADPANCF